MRIKFILSVLMFVLFSVTSAQNFKKEAFGIWTLQHMPSGKYHSPDATLFYYNDSTLTRRLISLGLNANAPQEDIYKL